MNNTTPNSNWTLTDWFKAVGAKSGVEVIRVADEIYKDDPTWSPWLESGFAYWKKKGIPERPQALQMLRVLNHLARRNNGPGIVLRKPARTRRDFPGVSYLPGTQPIDPGRMESHLWRRTATSR